MMLHSSWILEPLDTWIFPLSLMNKAVFRHRLLTLWTSPVVSESHDTRTCWSLGLGYSALKFDLFGGLSSPFLNPDLGYWDSWAHIEIYTF